MKILCLFSFLFLSLFTILFAESNSTAYIIPIHGDIDLGLSRFVDRVCSEAKEKKVDLVVLDIDSSGGRVDAAVRICDALNNLGDIPTFAFITGDAWDVGALVSLVCKTIVMTTNSSIGSGEQGSGDIGEELADKKTISEIIAKFKAGAERNGHSVKLANAMVDKDVELFLIKIGNKVEILDSAEWEAKDEEYKKKAGSYTVLSGKGKLLNLTSNAAKDLGLAKDILDTKEELMESLEMKDANIIVCKFRWQEALIRFITHPVICSLLLTIGFLGLIFELRIPGWGLSGTLSLIALGIFLFGHYLAGLANWMDIILFLTGAGLLVEEVFITARDGSSRPVARACSYGDESASTTGVACANNSSRNKILRGLPREYFIMPNFKIMGISGMIFIVVSLFFALIKNPLEISSRELLSAFFIIAYTFVLSLIIAVAGLKLLPKSRMLRKLVLPQENRFTR